MAKFITALKFDWVAKILLRRREPSGRVILRTRQASQALLVRPASKGMSMLAGSSFTAPALADAIAATPPARLERAKAHGRRTCTSQNLEVMAICRDTRLERRGH